ncbi:MAG: hypothetical protein ACR2MX_07390 [Cyclobacteriaceae bacterium]
MDQEVEYLKDITQIKDMMQRSSRFISLSGLSGVMAGIYALAGAYWAYQLLDGTDVRFTSDHIRLALGSQFWTLLVIALSVLLLTIVTGVWLTTKRAKKQGLKVWDDTARRLVVNLAIPLVSGGIFCLILLKWNFVGVIAPVMLIFYGLGLVNASKYTLTDIRYLGLCEIVLGLIAAWYMGYGLLFWAIGFGVLHIIYGSLMYFKYER